MPRFRLSALVVLAGLLVTAVACGGDDAPDATLPAGVVTCDPLLQNSYRFTTQVDLDLGPVPTAEPTPTAQGTPAFHFTSSAHGDVQDGVKIHGWISNVTGGARADYEAIQIGDTGYQYFPDQNLPWRTVDLTKTNLPYPYRPDSLCPALVPDLDTSQLEAGDAEEINGVNAIPYELKDLSTAFFNRSIDFTGGQVDVYIKAINGTVWVATDDRYPVKFDFTGQGTTDSGQTLTVQVQFESSDFGGDVKVEAPEDPEPAQ